MKVKSIIYMVLALSLCCGCSDWLTVDSKTILSEEDIAKYPELAEAQFLSNYAELRKSIHCIGDGAMSYRQHHLDAFTDDGASNITYENGVMRTLRVLFLEESFLKAKVKYLRRYGIIRQSML